MLPAHTFQTLVDYEETQEKGWVCHILQPVKASLPFEFEILKTDYSMVLMSYNTVDDT